jgi:hypothetical protein
MGVSVAGFGEDLSAGDVEREFGSPTSSAAAGAAVAFDAAGSAECDFGPRAVDACGAAAEVCEAAGDIVSSFLILLAVVVTPL